MRAMPRAFRLLYLVAQTAPLLIGGAIANGPHGAQYFRASAKEPANISGPRHRLIPQSS